LLFLQQVNKDINIYLIDENIILGPTPIVRILRQVLQEKQLEIQERKLLVLIATDGVPTNDNGQQDIKPLEHALRHERHPINRIPVTIIACTDDHECVG
jgi:hypothetical protein